MRGLRFPSGSQYIVITRAWKQQRRRCDRRAELDDHVAERGVVLVMYQSCEVRRSLMSAGWWPWAVYHSTTMVWHAKSAIHTNSVRP
ncbi:hypothetical protein [Streptomyces sp. NPDC002521]